MRTAAAEDQQDELRRLRRRIRRIAETTFRWKLAIGRATIHSIDGDGDHGSFLVTPTTRGAAPVLVRVDSTSQVSMFTGDAAVPCILAARDPRQLAALFHRYLTSIRRGQYRESRLDNGTASAAVIEIGRGIERAFVSYNTIRSRIEHTPPGWVRVSYRAY